MARKKKTDLSQPFFRQWREGGRVIIETNLPNDLLGDMATEWMTPDDWKDWHLYIAELEASGTRGQLVYHRTEMEYNPVLDGTPSVKAPLTSYNFTWVDYEKPNNTQPQVPPAGHAGAAAATPAQKTKDRHRKTPDPGRNEHKAL